MGMHTIISEGQGGISGGQRQWLMIARAVAPKPKILLFDEATSALDNVKQKKVSEAIDSLKCTRVVIAHRLSTIQHADRIIYLDQGKIAECGTYDELIAKNGLFARLVERQRLDLDWNLPVKYKPIFILYRIIKYKVIKVQSRRYIVFMEVDYETGQKTIYTVQKH